MAKGVLLLLLGAALLGCGPAPAAPSTGPQSPTEAPPEPSEASAAPAEAAPAPSPIVGVACQYEAVWTLDASGHLVDDDGRTLLADLGALDMVSAGGRAALVRTVSGQVWSVAGAGAPSRVSAFDGALELAVGTMHDCARDDAGAVRCRERGARPADPATEVALIALPGPARALVSGPAMMCALVAREAHCWGTQLSRGARRPGDGERFGPALRARDVDLAYVDAAQALHVLSGGVLSAVPPGRVSLELGDAVELMGDADAACVRTTSGAVRCGLLRAGADSRMVGLATRDADAAPGSVREVFGVASASCGASDHACAVVDGEAWCWGNDDHGAFGSPSTVSSSPRTVEGIGRAVDLDVSGPNSCVVNDAGEVWCWGMRNDGRDAPARIPGLGDRRGVAIDGYGYGCAWSDSDARCWDENGRTRTITAATVGVIATVGGAYCALPSGADASTRCWSSVDRFSGGGVVGVERFGFALPAAVRTAAFGDSVCSTERDDVARCYTVDDVVSGSATARSHGADAPELAGAIAWDATRIGWCALRAETLSCGGRGLPASPVRVRAGEVSVGMFACVLRVEGGVACFDGAGPLAVSGVESAVEVGVGDRHACVRDADGAVRCWGDASQGRLGVTLPSRPMPRRLERLPG